MTESKAMIVGLAGAEMTPAELAFIADQRPWGYILFARNIVDADQLKRLTQSIRDASGRDDVPILIDQEGGRVQRLKPPLAPLYPPASILAQIYRTDRKAGLRATWLMSRLHAFDLQRYGINVDCLPVLDIPVAGSHSIIGDRAYGADADVVIAMASAAVDGLMAGGVLPVAKHVPGHGRARSDSHLELPVVDTALDELEATDFKPFAALSGVAMAMTAHVVYSAIDAANPATTSKTLISDIIRRHIGFDGLLMSDDVSMKALSGTFESRTAAIFAAGCDVALHCNGDMDEMLAIAGETPVLAGDSLRRANAVSACRRPADNANEAAARDEFDALLSSGAMA
ncbi:beta-N-acetylhexosaminidase [Pararhizobium haloflavum]|uniref:beta-N-acetylhexosaminidase n=1 Tax=Pararhizobium haloflavum TaxID=2037914 RepID=UPI000C185F3B|nr:beta-N-acetylhexosaminidase [Pararhizobium haloflavum]